MVLVIGYIAFLSLALDGLSTLPTRLFGLAACRISTCRACVIVDGLVAFTRRQRRRRRQRLAFFLLVKLLLWLAFFLLVKLLLSIFLTVITSAV
jgi:hypothetical protein